MIRPFGFSAPALRYSRRFLIFPICLCFILTAWVCPKAFGAVERPSLKPHDTVFPLYRSIEPNVKFWVRIFSEVSRYEGLLHDTRNLNLVYDKIKLYDGNTSSGRKKNRRLTKKLIRKYKNILLALAQGHPPKTETARRVNALFGPNAKTSDFKTAAYQLRVQTGLKEEFIGGLKRSGAFIDEFRRIFRYHGLPEDLVYMPCVESSYRYKAYSKFGASGIWQFTRSTGRLYMKIGYVVDERRDPFISTHAAARLLKKNYRELKAWPLAITAYNHGLNGMLRAKKAKGGYENIFKSYRSRSFKFASRNFYSEFLAARHVAENHKKYFGRINFNAPMQFHTLKTRGFLPADAVAEHLGVSKSTLQKLNPALRPPVFSGQKHIPKNYELKLPRKLDPETAGNKLAKLYLKRQKPSRFHRVQKGDTAGAIARQHGVSVSDLILVNGLNRRATIYVGQNLRIPVKDEIMLARNQSSPVYNNKKILIKKPAPKAAPSEKPAVRPKVATGKKKITKEGRAPETFSPAKKESPRLPKAPSQAREISTAGEKSNFPVNPNIVTGNLKIIKTRIQNGRRIGTIKVQPEETLGHYSDWLGIKTQQIRVQNKFKYGSPITIDQIIQLPLPSKEGIVQEFEEKRYEYHKEMEEDFFESYEIQGIDTYRIKKGDNIWTLSLNELELPIWLLKKYNPDTDFSILMPSLRINIPVIGPKIPN